MAKHFLVCVSLPTGSSEVGVWCVHSSLDTWCLSLCIILTWNVTSWASCACSFVCRLLLPFLYTFLMFNLDFLQVASCVDMMKILC